MDRREDVKYIPQRKKTHKVPAKVTPQRSPAKKKRTTSHKTQRYAQEKPR